MKISKILRHLFLITVSFIFIFPLIWIIITSLRGPLEVLREHTLLIKNFHWENYISAWNAANFPRQFLNSFVVAISVTLGQIFTSALAGYALARMKFRGRRVIFMTVLATLIIPYHMLIVPLFIMLSKFGWINTYRGLIIPMLANGFGIYLFRQFFRKVP
ncbi:MAG: carbohydrate ABC transporter permease, partial [Elusimicrobiota bacterium]